jgi:hypothetical protein
MVEERPHQPEKRVRLASLIDGTVSSSGMDNKQLPGVQ